MRIALDATPLTVPTGGVHRYTSELSLALAREYPGDEFWLLSDASFSCPDSELPNLRCGHGPRNVLERRWWLWGLQGEISRRHIDLFHGTDFSVPYLPIRPAVLTLHDLSPWMDPKWHADDRVRRRTPLLLRLGLATMVVTPTEAVRRHAMDHFHLAPARVVAIPLAASAFFCPTPVSQPVTPYFLYVGTLEPRKNIALILDAWREIRREHLVDLVIAGRRRDDFPEIPTEPGLRLLGAIPDSDLPALYSGALASLYPSEYEGFGLPVLEAMQCGAAVFTSLDPAIAEVAGDAAARLDTRDPSAWVEAMRSALTRPDWIADLRQAGLRRAAQFSWAQTAALTREVYAEAARRFRAKT